MNAGRRKTGPRLGPLLGFAIYHASHDDYQDSLDPTGTPVGACEDALDAACVLYLGNPAAWL
jgi:hypothetical protein